MKKITTYTFIIFITFLKTISAQCDASFLASSTPLPVDNSGNTTNFIVMFNNEYTTLSNLIIGDTYTISSPGNTLFLTLRDVIDNSVITSGNSPLTFTANTTEIEIHLFILSSCPTTDPAGTFYVLAATNESTLGLDNVNFERFKIFPNPVKNKINIKSKSNYSTIKIYNIEGQLKLKKAGFLNTIDISEFQNGIYFLNILSNGYNVTRKIIKI